MNRAQTAYSTTALDEAAVVQRHRALVDRVCRRMAAKLGSPHLAEELWSAGALGLLDAARRFDGMRAVKFETFAEHRIRGAILDELRRNDHLPRRLRARTEELHKARVRLGQALGREAEPEELASALGLDVEEVAELEQLRQPIVPLDSSFDAASDSPAVDDTLVRRQLARQLGEAISTLPERLQLVLSLHYSEELTYREIASMLGVSEPRVCQLHKDAVSRLRAAMPGQS